MRLGRPLFRLLLLGLLVYNLLVWGLAAAPARAALNGAGLVVRHGDGRVIYAYVEFAEPRLSGVELLRRAGLAIVTGHAGFGESVCAINGEGCPVENCFCKSYGSPSFYWRYYLLKEGRWVYSSLGASNRFLADGDVDGWEWASGPPRLPAVTIDEIAARAGVARAAPAASPTAASATAAAPPSPAATPPPPVASPTLRPPTPSPTVAPAAAAAPPTATRPPPAQAGAAATAAGPRPAAPATPRSAPSPPPATADGAPALPAGAAIGATPAPPVVSPTPASASLATPAVAGPVAPSPAATAAPAGVAEVAEPAARAVVVAPSGGAAALHASDGAAPPVAWPGYLAALALGLALAGYLWLARRRRLAEGEDDEPDAR
jgi:hypothetical protein